MKTVLFLCTGNYYRSRFAEMVFNALAAERGLKFRADSRGLQLFAGNEGPLSPFARQALDELGIPVGEDVRFPAALTVADLERCAHVVAVKETEHRPLMERHFPEWVDAVEYWEIHDLDCSTPAEALPLLQREVEALADRLRDGVRRFEADAVG